MLRRVAGLLLPLALVAPHAAAQSQVWARQAGTPFNEYAFAAASDASGAVWVGGSTEGSLYAANAGFSDIWLARLDGAGAVIWTRQFGTNQHERATAAAADGAGGVYFAGETGGSLAGPGPGKAWLARYGPGGNELWIRQFGTVLSDAALAAAPDGSGGVFVSGSTTGSLGGPNAGAQDAWIARYDSAGTQLWVRQLGSSLADLGSACAGDGAGGVYVSGSTWGDLGGPNAGAVDAWVARYDGAGNQLWIRHLGTASDDFLLCAAGDGSGNVHVGGRTKGSLGGPVSGASDIWLARYDAAGNQSWVRQLGTSLDDEAAAMCADGSGGVYVSGTTRGSLAAPVAGFNDVWLAHYGPAGNPLGIQQLGGQLSDEVGGAAPDGSGGLFLSGGTFGDIGGPNAGASDLWVARFESSCSGATVYCTAKLNSAGCLPAIAGSGFPSASAGAGFSVSASQVLPGQLGTFFYGTAAPAAISFQGGTLCTQPPVLRTTIQSSGGSAPCGGTFGLDFNAWIAGGSDPGLTAGVTVYGQYWSRDPGDPFGTNLTDAVEFLICP